MAKEKYKEWLEPDKLILIEGWARSGLIDEQIAHNIGVTVWTLSVWKKEHPLIAQALKKGKEVADFEVEGALYKRAMGYRTCEVIKELNKTTGKMEVVKETWKDVPPDPTAQIFWLKNRLPKRWKNNPDDKEKQGGVTIVNNIPRPTDNKPV